MVSKAKYIIKKYQNRKLYDPQESMHINLETLVHLNESRDLVIIDHEGKDITLPTLFESVNSLMRKRFVLGHIKGKDAKFLRAAVNQIGEVLL